MDTDFSKYRFGIHTALPIYFIRFLPIICLYWCLWKTTLRCNLMSLSVICLFSFLFTILISHSSSLSAFYFLLLNSLFHFYYYYFLLIFSLFLFPPTPPLLPLLFFVCPLLSLLLSSLFPSHSSLSHPTNSASMNAAASQLKNFGDLSTTAVGNIKSFAGNLVNRRNAMNQNQNS